MSIDRLCTKLEIDVTLKLLQYASLELALDVISAPVMELTVTPHDGRGRVAI